MAFRRQHIRNIRATIEAGTPLIAEYVYDQTLKTIRAGDGATLGGVLLKKWGKSYTLVPAQIAADQNDYNPADLAIAEAVVLDLNADRSVTGLAGGATDREITLYNGSAFRLTLPNENAGSIAANRFHNPAGLDIVVRNGQSVRLLYSAALSRWIVISAGAGWLGVTDLSENVTLSGDISPAQIAANQNDYNPAGLSLASRLRLNTDASRNVTGIAGGADGRLLIVINVGVNPLVLQDANAGSAAGNRFDFGADCTLGAKAAAVIQYDATDSRWKMLGNTAGASVADGAVTARKLANSAAGGNIVNGKLVYSVAGSALTIALKTLAGADPSAADPVWARVRDTTVTTDAADWMQITAALSLVISSGSSLGVAANNTAFRIWLVLFNDAGTPRIGAINCLSGTNIYPLGGWTVASSTAEGGAGAADAAQVFYTGTAVAAKPYAVLGYASWETGLAALSTWSAGPTRAQLFTTGVALPGLTLQRVRSATGAVATGTTAIPHDDTIPQNTEGDQYLSQAIVPSSASNLLKIRTQLVCSFNSIAFMTAALFQDAIANALLATEQTIDAAGYIRPIAMAHDMLAGLSVSTTFKVRAGSGATTTVNGAASARVLGGVENSYLEIEEIVA